VGRSTSEARRRAAELGVFQLSVDGQPLLDLHGPTLLFDSRSGAVDLPNPDLSNYRGPDPGTGATPIWSSTVFYDGLPWDQRRPASA
jgi:hypothetical protein